MLPAYLLQGGAPTTIQGSSPRPQASNSSSLQLQPASTHAVATFQPANYNPQQGGTPVASFSTPTHAASTPAAPALTTGTGNSNGYGYSYNTGQFNPAQAQQTADLYNAAYNQKIGTLQQLLGGLQGRQQGLNDEIGHQYDSERQTLDTGHNAALRDIALGLNQLHQNHDLTLRNISQDAADTENGLNYKIGTLTPYDSSASPLLAIALAKQAERSRGDVGQQYNYQVTGFNNKQNDAENQYGNSVNSLNVWKQNNLADIARNVKDYQDQLDSQITDANTSRQLALANLAQYNGSSVLGNLAALQAQYNPNNIGYNPADHQAVQTAVQNMTANIPTVQSFNVPSLGVIQ